jgi:XTP/dITP diphosphohydrolase
MSSRSDAVREILLATHNAGKISEIRRVAGQERWRWRSLDEFPGVRPAVEDGCTFAENARRKALHYAAATGLPTLADDSGLEVDALGGAPGVQSARYAGQPRDDAANNLKLTAALAGVPPEKRTARFRCVMALAMGDSVVAETHGVVEGLILDEPRGENGFGYDPHFLLPNRSKTMAELSPDEKNSISHRGRALRAMLPEIARLLAAQPDGAEKTP